MSAQPQQFLSPEEYLDLDRASEFRHEYFNGSIWAMSGGSHIHAIIAGNLAAELRESLKSRPCMVTTSDLRVRITQEGLYTYPDLVLVCGSPQYLDHRRDTVLNPVLVVEVLSPSTEAYDRGFKSAQYRKLDSLQEYALVSQSEPRVEIYRRRSEGGWLLDEAVGMDAVCRFESAGCSVAMNEIYEKVAFEQPAPQPNRPEN